MRPVNWVHDSVWVRDCVAVRPFGRIFFSGRGSPLLGCNLFAWRLRPGRCPDEREKLRFYPDDIEELCLLASTFALGGKRIECEFTVTLGKQLERTGTVIDTQRGGPHRLQLALLKCVATRILRFHGTNVCVNIFHVFQGYIPIGLYRSKTVRTNALFLGPASESRLRIGILCAHNLPPERGKAGDLNPRSLWTSPLTFRTIMLRRRVDVDGRHHRRRYHRSHGIARNVLLISLLTK